MEFKPVRLPRRTLTPAQAAKFAALREEIEHELAARAAARTALPEHRTRRMRRRRNTR